MAALEGQRAALSTMLSEQRGEIGQVQSRLSELERQQGREAALTEMGERAAQLAQHREQTEAALRALEVSLTEHLGRVTAHRLDWAACRAATEQYAVQHLGVSPLGSPTVSGWSSLVEELNERGAVGDALRYSPAGEERSGLSPFHIPLAVQPVRRCTSFSTCGAAWESALTGP